MAIQLTESDFLTIDLGTIYKNQTPSDTAKPAAVADAAPSQSGDTENDLKQIKDWGKELKARLDANARLGKEAREDEAAVEAKFFEDYFNNADPKWDAACAKQLLSMGEPLRKALKVLGFGKRTNPILGFILNKTVINRLIKPGLLNINTFKAIYNAVAKKLIADSQFFSANDYNIIYCKDLYSKPLTEIIAYLELQKKILATSASSYPAELLEKNRRVFMFNKKIKETDVVKRVSAIYADVDELGEATRSISVATGTLNSIKLAQAIYTNWDKNGTSNIDTDTVADSDTDAGSEAEANNIDTEKLNILVNKIGNKPADILAALQFMYIKTGNSIAKKAMATDKLSSVQIPELTKALDKVSGIMPKNALGADTVNNLTRRLIGRL